MKKTTRNALCTLFAFILCLCFLSVAAADAASQAAQSFANEYSDFVKTQPERIPNESEPGDPTSAVNTRIVYINPPGARHDVVVMVVVSEKETCVWEYDLSSSAALNVLRIGKVFDGSAPVNAIMLYNGNSIERTEFWMYDYGADAFLEFIKKANDIVHVANERR